MPGRGRSGAGQGRQGDEAREGGRKRRAVRNGRKEGSEVKGWGRGGEEGYKR